MRQPLQLENAADSDLRKTEALAGVRYRFYKIMFPFAAYELKLPEEFSRRYGGNLSSVVRVIAPTVRVWPVSVEKPSNEVWFREGWPEFVQHHAIEVWSLMLFTYEGDSSFRVHIYDPCTAMRRNYPGDVPSILEDEDRGNNCLVVDEKHDEDDSSVEILGSSPSPCPRPASKRITRSSIRESHPTPCPPTRNKMPEQHQTPGLGSQLQVYQPHPSPKPTTGSPVHKIRQPTPRLATRSELHKTRPTRSEACKTQPPPRLAIKKEQTQPTRLARRNEARKTQPTRRLATRSEVCKTQSTRPVTRSGTRKTQSTRPVTRSGTRKTQPTPSLATRSELQRPHPTSRPTTRTADKVKHENFVHTPHLTPRPAAQSETRELCPTLEPTTNSTMLELYPTQRLSRRNETRKRRNQEKSRQSKRAKNVEEDNYRTTGGVHSSSPIDENVELCYIGGNAETPASEGPICAAGLLKSENPSFMVTLRPNRRGSFTVNFPRCFAQTYLSEGQEHIKLRVGNGRQQLIRCTLGKEKLPTCLGEGWPAFALHHGLVKDDVCIFELIKRGEDVLFQVHTIVVCG